MKESGMNCNMHLTCDNCGNTCTNVVIDSTLYHGDRKFLWGVDCPCGKKRWPNAESEALT